MSTDINNNGAELPPVSSSNGVGGSHDSDRGGNSSGSNGADGQGQAHMTQRTNDTDTHRKNSSGITGASPQIADDVDLIEKEWVEKAKEIVEKTKENPYLQNKAISEIKADYIQKRYNKQVIKSEE